MWSLLKRLLRRRRGVRASDGRTLSVAIPVYGDPAIALRVTRRLVRDPRVARVVLNDDASPGRHAREFAAGAAKLGERVGVYRNPVNLGAFANKLATVALCPPGFVLLLDSDNVAGEDYLDALFDLPHWDPGVIYCPELAAPDFDYRRIRGQLIDFAAARRILSRSRIRWFRTFLNTGNFVVDRDRYVACAQPYRDIAVAAADVIAFNYLWLRGGGRMKVVPGMHYEHARHDSSFFARHASVSTDQAHDLARAFARDHAYAFARHADAPARAWPQPLAMHPEPA